MMRGKNPDPVKQSQINSQGDIPFPVPQVLMPPNLPEPVPPVLIRPSISIA